MSSTRRSTPGIGDNQLLEVILENTPILVGYLDCEFNFIRVNRAYAEADDREPSFFPGKNHFDLYPNQENERIFRTVVETGEPYFVQARQFVYENNPERGVTWWDWNLVPVKDDDGRVTALVLTLVNVTEQKLAEKALCESESIYRRTIENASGVPYQLDFVGRKYVFMGAAIEDLVGIPQEKFSPQAYSEMILEQVTTDPDGPEDHATYGLAFWRGDVVRYRADTRIQSPSGDIKWISDYAVPIHDDSGQVVGSLGILLDITERKRAEQELAVERDRAQTYLDAAGTIMVALNANGEVTLINQKGCRTLGYKEQEILGKNWFDTFLPRDVVTEVKAVFQRLTAGELEPAEYFENNVVTASGDLRRMAWHNSMLRDETDTIVGVLSSGEDITERKRSDALKRVQRRLAIALNAVTGLEKAMVLCLDAAIDGTRMDAGGLYLVDEGSGALDLVYSRGLSPEFVETVSHYSADSPSTRLVMGGESVHASHRELGITLSDAKKREGLRAMSVFPVKLGDQVIACLNLASHSLDEMPLPEHDVLHAITAQMSQTLTRLRAQEELRQSNEKLNATLNALPDLMFEVDREGRIHGYRAPQTESLHARPEQFLGKTVSEVLPDEAAQICMTAVNEAVESGHHRGAVYGLDMPQGHCWYQLSIAAKGDPITSEGRLIVVARDITEIKRLQELESRAQRLETAGQIAGQVAHDFNNLLAPLMAYPEFIKEELTEDHPALKYVAAIEKAAQQIADINQQLLTLGRRGHYNQQIMNLNDVATQAVCQLDSPPSTLVVDTQLDDSLMNIKGGGSQILRAISNLLVNAREAMQDIGQITIRTENYYVDDLLVDYARVPRGEYVKLTITDTGCGIPDEIRARVFDPFFTTKTADKKRGSGLGISVVDAVVKDHGGYIDVSSKLGQGTSFYIYFPITRETVDSPIEDGIIGGRESILIVDDDKVQRDVSLKLLSSLGYKATEIESGEGALEMLQKQAYDLLILDMIMPGGIDGAETYERALNLNSEQKAIIVSGFAESDRVAAALKIGAGAFVKKPLTRRRLAVAVRDELDKATHPAFCA